jgi:tetratricopeptide (TPR) repeat protein
MLGAIAFPTQSTDLTRAEEKFRENARHYFEEVWIHKPLKSLAGNSPLDAVGSSVLRKKVFGAVKFVGDCFVGIVPHKKIGERTFPVEIYDFSSLRHKLGLEYVTAEPPKVDVPAEPTPAPPVVEPPPVPVKREVSAMNAAELAGLDVAAMSVAELETAMKAAVKLDARDLAVAFAQAGLLKPFDPAHADRYPLYACLIAGSLSEGDLAKAVQLANDGAWYDGEQNENRRANEYGQRKAQLYAKQKNVDKAVEEFDVLIARNPDEGRYYTTAAEEMLRLKNGGKALYFVEKGLAKAREIGNRDLEGHCLELQAAAKRM